MKFGPRFSKAVTRFDEENGRDPTLVVADEVAYPQELLYAMHLTEWVIRLQPEASEHLLLAARSQHICRWTIPRNSYEMTRSGYLRWRTELKQFHARKTGEILREVGYDEATITKVCDLNLKKNLGRDYCRRQTASRWAQTDFPESTTVGAICARSFPLPPREPLNAQP